jgi:plasmid rolling circle replication initiator protein Rep
VNNWNIEKAQDMKYSIWRAKFKILRNYGERRDRCRGGNTIFSLQI